MNCFKSINIKSVKAAIAPMFLTQIILTQIFSMAAPTTWRSLMPSAIALPGQTPDQVLDWIKTNPALRPAIGERLLVRKSDTPSKRFQFQASVFRAYRY